jgi:hypothetical protein
VLRCAHVQDTENGALSPVKCQKDMSIKEGEKIKVVLGLLGGRDKESAGNSKAVAGNQLPSKSKQLLAVLARPPPPGTVVKPRPPNTTETAEVAVGDDCDDEWEDFQGSTAG